MKLNQLKLDALNEQIEAAERLVSKYTGKLSRLTAKRTALIEAAHTWTAADYRLVLLDDPNHGFSFEDVEPEPPTEDDTEAFKARYRALHDAYYGERCNGIYSLMVRLDVRDIETGEWAIGEDYIGGLYHIDSDSRADIFEWARDSAQNFEGIREGVKVGDIQMLSEDELK